MQLKKLFAGIAAAATLLGGMALGAGTAVADVTEGQEIEAYGQSSSNRVSLKLTAGEGAESLVNGHTFRAVELGDYVSGIAVSKGHLKSITTKTYNTEYPLDGVKDLPSILDEVLKTVDEDANTDGVQNAYVGSSYETAKDPIAYVAANYIGFGEGSKDTTSATAPYEGLLRDFVTALTANADYQAYANAGGLNQDVAQPITGANGVASFGVYTNGKNPDPRGVNAGLYLIEDITPGATAKTLPVLTGTKFFSGAEYTGSVQEWDLDGYTAAGYTLGEVNVKPAPNKAPATPVKSIVEAQSVGKDGLTGSAQVGDYVKYQITTSVPDLRDISKSEFTVTDGHKSGLEFVKGDADHPVTVTVGSGDDAKDVPSDWDGESTWQYTWKYVPTVSPDPDGNYYVIFYLDKYVKDAGRDTATIGKPLTITYYMRVTKDAVHATKVAAQGNVNNASVDVSKLDGSYGTDTIAGNSTTLYTYDTAFTKKSKADDSALAGAGFKVQNAQGQWLAQDADGVWSAAADEASATELKSAADGSVALKGLGEGVYTVKESTVPTGFLASSAPTFTVTVADQDAEKVLDGAFTVAYAETSKTGLVVPDAANDTAVVYNVTSITQLPLTGGAGIALFTVIAAALLGAGAFGAVRMRRQSVAGRSVRA